ncbi:MULTISPECIES: hypothetical protein, partial [Enterobacteriaceae]|uniref:hypothetical protein n=1 Tax=Citrobacter freundii TaxID=546 RepID=UPI001F5D7E8B
NTFDLFGFYALYGTFFRRTGHRPNSSVHLNIAFFAVPLSLQNSSAIFDGSLACIQATFHVR